MLKSKTDKHFLYFRPCLMHLPVAHMTVAMCLVLEDVSKTADYCGTDDGFGNCFIHRSLSQLSDDTALPPSTVSRALFALEEADLLFVDRSGTRNRRKNDRTTWMTVNYARLREMGIEAYPDHEHAVRAQLARVLRQTAAQDVDAVIADASREVHIPEVTIVHFVEKYGREAVREKLDMLRDVIADGQEIRSPAGWLQAALEKNYESKETREEKRRKARKEEGERRAKRLEEQFAREDEARREAYAREHPPLTEEEAPWRKYIPEEFRHPREIGLLSGAGQQPSRTMSPC